MFVTFTQINEFEYSVNEGSYCYGSLGWNRKALTWTFVAGIPHPLTTNTLLQIAMRINQLNYEFRTTHRIEQKTAVDADKTT